MKPSLSRPAVKIVFVRDPLRLTVHDRVFAFDNRQISCSTAANFARGRVRRPVTELVQRRRVRWVWRRSFPSPHLPPLGLRLLVGHPTRITEISGD
jgi:hypothetical protein